MDYVREAFNYGNLALENSVKSQHPGRVAQTRFYMACVEAREVKLDAEMEVSAQETSRKCKEALLAISTTLEELRKVNNLNVADYEAMAKEYTAPLMSSKFWN